MSNYKSFIANTAIYGLAAVLPRIITFILTAVFTIALNTTHFSQQTNWFIYAAFINVVLSMGMETAFFRFYTSENNKANIISNTFLIILVNTLIFALIGFVFADAFTAMAGFDDTIIVKILILTTILDAWAIIPFALIRVTERPWKFMTIKVLNTVIYFALICLFLLYLPTVKTEFHLTPYFQTGYQPGIFHIILANFIASAITMLLLISELKSISWYYDKTTTRQLLAYGLPIMVAGFAYIINENYDKLYIAKVLGDDQNGIYSASYRLGVFMTLYIMAFRLGAEPFFFNVSKDLDAKSKYKTVMHWFIILGTILMLGVVVFIDVIAAILLQQDVYKQGLKIVPIILLANLFSGIYINLSIWYKLTNKTVFGMYISIFGAFLTIATLMFFVPKLGYIGGAYATLATYFTMACISYFIGKKYFPVPYDITSAMMFVGLSTLLSYICFYVLRGQFAFNIAILIFYIAVVYFKEGKKLRALIKR